MRKSKDTVNQCMNFFLHKSFVNVQQAPGHFILTIGGKDVTAGNSGSETGMKLRVNIPSGIRNTLLFNQIS